VPEIDYFPVIPSIPFHVCETPTCGYHPVSSDDHPWAEEELARIRRILKRLTSHRVCNPEDAEDLVQETMLTMVRKAPEAEIEKGMLNWSMGILRNKVGNYYRKSQRGASLVARANLTSDALPGPADLSNPKHSLHHAELCERIREILSKLSAQERQAIGLLLRGLETREIAALLHPERYQNIVNRLHRGRRKLARELARYGYARRGSRRQRRPGRRPGRAS
jgi:RNA polymerase sigma factor (sigma-70 family)